MLWHLIICENISKNDKHTWVMGLWCGELVLTCHYDGKLNINILDVCSESQNDVPVQQQEELMTIWHPVRMRLWDVENRHVWRRKELSDMNATCMTWKKRMHREKICKTEESWVTAGGVLAKKKTKLLLQQDVIRQCIDLWIKCKSTLLADYLVRWTVYIYC